MATWEYRTLYFVRHQKKGMCGWVIVTREFVDPERVGDTEKRRFSMFWQAAALLETALAELDLDGWELVSTSYGGFFGFYGLAVVRRSVTGNPQGSSS